MRAHLDGERQKDESEAVGRRVRRAARLAGCAALALLARPEPVAGLPAISFPFAEQSGCGPNNVEGWGFTTTAPVMVSALGVYDSSEDGMNFPTPVGLYDASCELLASVTIPAGSEAQLLGGYRYVGITPLVLGAGNTYRIAAVMHCDDFTPELSSLSNLTLAPGVAGVVSWRIGFGAELACPTQINTQLAFAPNFLVGAACGNGVVQGDEVCDDGNLVEGDCCSPTCDQYGAEGNACQADDQPCTDDVCDAIGTCLHPAGHAGAVCRAAADDCDMPELCDGIDPFCPEDDLRQPDGAPCADDGSFCSGPEICSGGTCVSAGDPCDGLLCDEAGDQCLTPAPTETPVPSASDTPDPTPTPPATATPSSTASPTLAPAATASPTASAVDTATPQSTPTATAPGAHCVGDCDGDGAVQISELITGVTIAVGSQPLDRCSSLDTSANGAVEINELITAVTSALAGCPGAPPFRRAR